MTKKCCKDGNVYVFAIAVFDKIKEVLINELHKLKLFDTIVYSDY